jgi:hypothetical protein
MGKERILERKGKNKNRINGLMCPCIIKKVSNIISFILE